MSDPVVRIQGAGPVGILAALFLARYGWDKSAIELIDPAIAAPLPAHADDPRILALSHGTLVRLAQLGVHADITRIKHIHVSAKGHLGAFEVTVDDYAAPAPSSRGAFAFGTAKNGAVSRCDIHTVCSSGKPANSCESTAARPVLPHSPKPCSPAAFAHGSRCRRCQRPN